MDEFDLFPFLHLKEGSRIGILTGLFKTMKLLGA